MCRRSGRKTPVSPPRAARAGSTGRRAVQLLRTCVDWSRSTGADDVMISDAPVADIRSRISISCEASALGKVRRPFQGPLRRTNLPLKLDGSLAHS